MKKIFFPFYIIVGSVLFLLLAPLLIALSCQDSNKNNQNDKKTPEVMYHKHTFPIDFIRENTTERS